MINLGGIKTELNGKAVGVVGLGRSGQSVIQSLKKYNVPYHAWDDNSPTQSTKPFFAQMGNDNNIGFIILAPGIPLTHPKPHDCVVWAKANNVPVIGDIELFWRAVRPQKTIAITGTNGKSTTTALIGHICKSCGLNTEIGGNLGIPVFDFSSDADIYVLELSSYQLDLLNQARFDVSVLLNFSPDHLARHGDMNGYIKAKERILKNCGRAIIGQDDNWSVQLAKKYPQALLFSQQKIDPDLISILENHDALRGQHNAQNAQAALLACLESGLNRNDILTAIKTFSGLAHRQEKIYQTGNIVFINDSKATNADATEKALSSYNHIYWIVGGRAKETGLQGLEKFATKIHHAFLIGESISEFELWMKNNNISYSINTLIDDAVTKAWDMAQSDKEENEIVILLSPACASFDQFENFEVRGDYFREKVLSLFPQMKKEAL